MTVWATGEPTLIVPPSLVVPDAARVRLRRQYDQRGRGAVGVATRVASIEVGSSVITTAERAAMAPLGAAVAVRDTEIRGAVLLQPGIEHVVTDHTVVIHVDRTAGSSDLHLVVDPGACAFDPLAVDPLPDDAPPASSARPPFRWRPLVLFLATADDPERAASVAHLANELVGLDVEPRLALSEPIGGPLLTRPCAPGTASLDALIPDVVVALDEHALATADAWAADHRHTVLVELDPALGDRLEIVPWAIGLARGRLRARIGARPDPAALARLVNRLCSGPVPGPPLDLDVDPRDDEPTPVSLGAPPQAANDLDPVGADEVELPTRPSFALSTGEQPSRLITGLADHLEAQGHERVRSADSAGVDVLLLDAELDDQGQIAIVEPAQRAPRAIRRVLVVDPGAPTSDRRDPPPAVPPDHRRRLDDTAGAITTSPAHAEHLHALGLATIVLPHLRTRAELDALERAHRDRVRPSATTVGLLVGCDAATTTQGAAEQVTAMAVLDEIARIDGDARLIAIDHHDSGERSTADLAPWTFRRTLPGPVDVAGWSMAVLVHVEGEPIRAAVLDDLLTLALAGVPVVVPAIAADAIGSLTDRTLVVDDEVSDAAWTARLLELDDEERRARASDRARRVAVGRAGSDAAALVIDRLLGWVAVVAP